MNGAPARGEMLRNHQARARTAPQGKRTGASAMRRKHMAAMRRNRRPAVRRAFVVAALLRQKNRAIHCNVFFIFGGGGRFRIWQFKFNIGLALQIVVGMRQRGQRIHGDRRTIERIGERLRHRARQAQARKLSRSRAERKGGAVGQLQVGFLQKARNKRQRNFGMGAGVRGKLAYLAAATQRRRKKRAAGFHRQDCGH